MIGEFHFLRPVWLVALLPLAWLVWRLWHDGRVASSWTDAVDRHLLVHMTMGSGKRRRTPWALLASGWLLSVIVLAGPVWSKIPQAENLIKPARVLIVDVSTSMDAGDLATSRLMWATMKLSDILDRSEQWRSALIVFARYPYLVAPLTSDPKILMTWGGMIKTQDMPVQGNRLDLALIMAADMLKRVGVATADIVLISDDNAVNPAALKAARNLHDQGHRLSVLGVGAEGFAPSTTHTGEKRAAVAALNESYLRQLARLGGGGYQRATFDQHDLDQFLLSPDAFQSSVEEDAGIFAVERWHEFGPALLLFLTPLLALAFRRGWLLAVLIVFAAPAHFAHAGEAKPLWLSADQQGAKMMQENPARAAELFENLDWKAVALYRAGLHPDAIKAWELIEGPDAHYNRGNALAQMNRLDDALSAYDAALVLDPNHEDARHNKKLIENLLGHAVRPDEQEAAPKPKDSNPGKDNQRTDPARAKKRQMVEARKSLDQWLLKVPDSPQSLFKWQVLQQHRLSGYPMPGEEP